MVHLTAMSLLSPFVYFENRTSKLFKHFNMKMEKFNDIF